MLSPPNCSDWGWDQDFHLPAEQARLGPVTLRLARGPDNRSTNISSSHLVELASYYPLATFLTRRPRTHRRGMSQRA